MIQKVFSIWDYIVLGGLLVSSTFIGIFFAWRGRKNPSSKQFFTGNRKLGLFPVTMSLVASFMSTNTLLGVPAEVYQVGTQFIMQNISICIAVFVAAEVFMPVFHDLNITSVNEYLMLRFNSKAVKLAGSIGFLVYTIPYMAVVLYGPAVALNSVTPLSIPTSILVVGIICTFYTSIGGIKAVIWTDVLQCLLMFMGVAIVIIQGVVELGGMGEVLRITDQGGRLKFFNFNFDIYNHDNFWNVVLGTTVSWTGAYCISQTQMQRYCSMETKAKARKSLYFNLPGLIILSCMAIMSGVVVYGKYRDCDPLKLGIIKRHDQLVPYYVMDSLQKFPGLPGLFVACVFSGSLSTLSSGFNALAAVTWEDFCKNRFKSMNNQTSMRIVTLLSLAYGFLAIGLSFGVGSLGTVMQASMSLSSSLKGPLFGLFFSAIFFRFVNAKGSLCGLFVGLCFSLSMALGSLVYPRPHVSMPTSYDHCPLDIASHYLNSSLNTLPEHKFITYYDNPEGLARFLHVSYLIMSVVGFVVSVVVNLTVSYLTGGAKANAKLDMALLSPMSRYLYSKK